MSTLDGKTALITGAARGQGRSHAKVLAEAGASIIAIDACAPSSAVAYAMPTEDDLEETAAIVEQAGGRVHYAVADTRDEDALSAAVAAGVRGLGGLDIVVANAGIYPFGFQAHEMPAADWNAVVSTNLTGTWQTCKVATPYLMESTRGAAIVIVGSTAGINGAARSSAYAVTKHGLKGLMTTLALELGPHNIRVNSVIPTAVDTPMCMNETVYRAFVPGVDQPSEEQIREAFQRIHVLPVPWVQPEDISRAVVFLTSQDARYITGTELKVDAGYTIK
jgi:SDR family mycofactocin-dependent oxidoreductase